MDRFCENCDNDLHRNPDETGKCFLCGEIFLGAGAFCGECAEKSKSFFEERRRARPKAITFKIPLSEMSDELLQETWGSLVEAKLEIEQGPKTIEDFSEDAEMDLDFHQNIPDDLSSLIPEDTSVSDIMDKAMMRGLDEARKEVEEEMQRRKRDRRSCRGRHYY